MKFVIPSIFTAVNKYSSPLREMEESTDRLTKSINKAGAASKTFDGIAKSAKSFATGAFMVGTALALPLGLAANAAIQFEDRMADVAKTTGLEGKNLESLSAGILDYSKKTRTSIEELQKIAAIGGQQGILGEQNILDYTKAVDKFSVALGSDFGGDVASATQAISGLNKLFKETRDLAPDKSITQVGSAMNALSAKGVQVPNLNEFALRVGQLPDAIKPSIQSTLALGAVLDKAKIPAEVSARAYGDFVTGASKNLSGFAKQMGITTKEAQGLINTKPEVFLAKFSQSLKGLNAQQISKNLEKLKIGDTGTIKLVGALASNLDMLQEFTALSNNEFAKGTSLLDEYNKVNNTTAGKLAQAKNNIEAFTIVIGTQLLPTITQLIAELSPTIERFSKWAKENPKTVSSILKITAAIAGLSFVFGGIATVVWAVSSGISAISATFAFLAPLVANYLVPALQVVWAVFTTLVEMAAAFFGISTGVFVGAIVLIGSIVHSIWRNWDKLVSAFKDGGIVEGLKMIGKVLLDAVLYPIQKLFELLGNPFGWADSINAFRADIGLNAEPAPAVNPKKSEQDAMAATIQENSARVQLDVNDPTGRTSIKSTSDLVNIRLGSSMTFE